MDKKPRLNCIYNDMKKRCYKPYCKAYKYYGARGITVCDEWLDNERIVIAYRNNATKGYLAFKKWALENGYSDDLTLERIDVNKGYSPENCRWATFKEQANNTRRNHLVTYKGETKTLQQWCDIYNLDKSTLRNRLKYGWSVEKAITTPSKNHTSF